jgi:hypothetical protein
MQVEFFAVKRRAKVNSDEVCAIKVNRLRHGATLETNWRVADLEMTQAVRQAVMERYMERWDDMRSSPHHWPRNNICSGPNYPMLFITCGEGMLEGWKAFLQELLSRPESWQPQGMKKLLDDIEFDLVTLEARELFGPLE